MRTLSYRLLSAAALGLLILGASPETNQSSSSPSSARTQTLDVADMDTGANACVDFYQYADGHWLEKNPIPADRPRWGTFDELRQRNQNDLRGILERLAAEKDAKTAPAGSEERKQLRRLRTAQRVFLAWKRSLGQETNL